MTTATAPAPLSLNGVRDGGPCWLMPHAAPAMPAFVPAAVLVAGPSGAQLLYRGHLYCLLDVHPTEAEARAAAARWAVWERDHARERLANAEAVLAALGDSP